MAGGVGTNTNHPFYIRTGSVPRVWITENGNVGIGTTENPLSNWESRAIGLDVGTGIDPNNLNVVASDFYMRNPKTGVPRWVSDTKASEARSVHTDELSVYHTSCTPANGGTTFCVSACSRYCRNEGFVGGTRTEHDDAAGTFECLCVN